MASKKIEKRHIRKPIKGRERWFYGVPPFACQHTRLLVGFFFIFVKKIQLENCKEDER